nr:uncharacterized protein LOC109162105 [Ipomoea batatas]
MTDDDLDELRGCIELGFGFDPDSPRLDPKLARTFPAMELYCAVHRHYGGGSFSRSSSTTLASTDSDTTSLVGNPLPVILKDGDTVAKYCGHLDGSKKPLPILTKAPPQANQLPMVEGQDWSSEGEFEEEDKVDENGESSNEDDGEQGKGCEAKETKEKTQLVN